MRLWHSADVWCPGVRRQYELNVVRPLPSCSDPQLTQWTAWTSCTPTCDGGLSTITRTRKTSAACASTFVESEDASCGALSCASEVDGVVGLEGVSLEQMMKVDSAGEQPLLNALKAAFAAAAGVLLQQVSITSVTASHRRVGISVEFKIFISTDSLGVSATSSLSSAASTGGLAATFTSEASQRGKVIAVGASLVTIHLVVSITTSTVSDAEYGWWSALFLCIGICFVVLWCFIPWDMLRVRRALAEKKSQHAGEKRTTEQIETPLVQQQGENVNSEEPIEEHLVAACEQELQQVFMRCG